MVADAIRQEPDQRQEFLWVRGQTTRAPSAPKACPEFYVVDMEPRASISMSPVDDAPRIPSLLTKPLNSMKNRDKDSQHPNPSVHPHIISHNPSRTTFSEQKGPHACVLYPRIFLPRCCIFLPTQVPFSAAEPDCTRREWKRIPPASPLFS